MYFSRDCAREEGVSASKIFIFIPFLTYFFFLLFLAGIEVDLFYVRDGAINDYAMSFVIPMKTGVDDLQFSWQSRTTYPVSLWNYITT